MQQAGHCARLQRVVVFFLHQGIQTQTPGFSNGISDIPSTEPFERVTVLPEMSLQIYRFFRSLYRGNAMCS